jgi:subtilisin-like proprotein convertase family protein
MRRNRSRLALLGVLALALSVTVGLTASDVAAAKKKKTKAGGTVEITKAVNAPVPDATATSFGEVLSTIDVGGKKFKGTRIRDVNVTLQTTGAASGSAGDLRVLLSAPNGGTVWLFAFLAGQSIGPLTLDDETANYLVSTTSPPRDSTQVVSPYQGTAQPYCWFAFGGCPLSLMDNGQATGTWTLRVQDTSTGNPANTSVLNFWKLTVLAGKAYATK